MTRSASHSGPPRPHEMGDYYGSDTGASGRGSTWQPVFQYDAEGYVVGRVSWTPPSDESGKRFMEGAARMRFAYPLPEIVMPLTPAGEPWPVDEDGRGLSVQEVNERLTKEQAA